MANGDRISASTADQVSRGISERFFFGGGGGGTSPVVIVYDSFTTGASTDLTLHPPDTDITGSGWSVTGGTWTVDGFGDYLAPPTSAGNYATFSPSGYTSYLVESKFKFNSDTIGLQLRFIDSNNRWNCFWNSSGSFRIQEITGGTAFNRDSATVASPVAGDAIWFSDDREGFYAGRNRGATELSYSSTQHDSSEKAGVTSVSVATGYDDFYLMGNTVDPNDLP